MFLLLWGSKSIKKTAKIKYDILAIVSGPEPQRTIFEKILIKELREIDIKRSVLDNSLIKSLTNWEPLIALEEGLDKFLKNDFSL